MYDIYNHNNTEEFARRTIACSYDPLYGDYESPSNPDNFDYISRDGRRALEVTTIISENEQQANEYRNIQSTGKQPSANRVKNCKLDENGELITYYGGSMNDLANGIQSSIERKNEKALRRLNNRQAEIVDLCLCIQDGSLFDKRSFEIFFLELDQFVFDRIFFITPSYFIVHEKRNGFEEYKKL